ncbi:MAG: alanine--tRNA ligase-related protein, partial [Candidatus Altiarchaeota archaeon]|nr:alanine--tRNA ligase-related protein [Candidatus Altiarchaeota archaeon]
MSGNESEYEVELFKEKGFSQKKCPECNRFFWTLGDKETCGEPPCDEYSFIRNPPTKKKLSLHEMRELYLRFFERNNHTRIQRYPIVARWREDVFFTQASIYCFQPWVILGVIKPPANPLTISQTCVRFNDIDNVGKTGRHFTMFEMMAHHSFNTPDNYVYFKDETVELCHRLLTEDLHINPEEISYIEAQWMGGGNSGPCFETLVGGVELATLVFMMYKEENGEKKRMNMQVVDTGYGLERFTWLTQGTSSAYEAVFGEVLLRLKKEAGILGDEEILSEYSKVAGLMNVESNVDLKILRKKVAERLEITPEKLHREMGPMENLYAICDHTRALMFMLQDGVMPSN